MRAGRRHGVRSRTRSSRSARPAGSSSRKHGAKALVALAAKPLDSKEQLALTIDPKKRPDWYLIDPTLKKGDVLFLRNRVVVFKGDRIGDLKDYVPVSGTRLLSRKERRLIEGAGFARHRPGRSLEACAARRGNG